MQLTKQQKLYAAVVGLAVGAFGFDRFVLGPPADGGAAVAAAPQPARAPVRRVAPQAATPAAGTATTASATTAGNTQGVAPTGTLAARLRQVAAGQKLDLRNVGDAFRPSVAWIGARRQPAPAAGPFDAAREFQNTHRLTAVMKQAGGGIAIIDKTTLAVGQSIDGFRLVAVKDRSAVLRRGTDRVELRLPEEQTLAAGALTPSGTGTGTSHGTAASEKVAGIDAGE